jgi:LPS-assembly protein
VNRRPFSVGLVNSLLRLAAFVLLAALLNPGAAMAQLLPPDFFAHIPDVGSAAQIEADALAYDARSDVITARGAVAMSYSGYDIHCGTLSYNQAKGDLVCAGQVTIRDPTGTVFTMERIEVTGSLKRAFVRSLTIVTADGAKITADSADYREQLTSVLNSATYAPCGDCIDSKGRVIGWRIRADRIVQDAQRETITLENPKLEILGIPVAWLPSLTFSDPTKHRPVRLPKVDYGSRRGASISWPFDFAIGDSADLVLTPTLLSRQGAMLGVEWQQRFANGEFDIDASGIYQLDPDAYAGQVGDRRWRGSIETTGRFDLAADWTAGWSYTAFTDAAFLGDYAKVPKDTTSLVNEAYATELSPDTYLDMRVQEFRKLGPEITDADQQKQALTVPNVRGDDYFNLGDGSQVHVSGSLLGVHRDADDGPVDFAGVPYQFGYAGNKLHATGQVDWQKQVILPGGLVATPFLGLRADAASYDGGSSLPGAPEESVLLSATPIAAVDVRWPLIATNGGDTHLLEPIAQLVYRGTDTTETGITNDNAHSFVLDDTNIFSYDRFSGTDRQETGLRAHVGARYLANFANGSWLEVTGGQSFHLAGANGLGTPDEVQTGLDSGLGTDASYVVLGARGAPSPDLVLGAKLQIDPAGPRVARAGFGADFSRDGYSLGGDYIYLGADPAAGVVADQQEVTVRGGVPLPMDYWKAKASLSWDLAQNTWLETRGEIDYDDGYFVAGAYAKLTGPTHVDPNQTEFGITLHLNGPSGDPL